MVRAQGGVTTGSQVKRAEWRDCSTRNRDDLTSLHDFYAALLATATHDLRQALQVVLATNELLARDLVGGRERKLLQRSSSAAAQLQAQLSDLADELRFGE